MKLKFKTNVACPLILRVALYCRAFLQFKTFKIPTSFNTYVLWPLSQTVYSMRIVEHVPAHIINHEYAHLRQIEKMGILRFILIYCIYYIKYGYAQHPFEVEARTYESKPLNLD